MVNYQVSWNSVSFSRLGCPLSSICYYSQMVKINREWGHHFVPRLVISYLHYTIITLFLGVEFWVPVCYFHTISIRPKSGKWGHFLLLTGQWPDWLARQWYYEIELLIHLLARDPNNITGIQMSWLELQRYKEEACSGGEVWKWIRYFQNKSREFSAVPD